MNVVKAAGVQLSPVLYSREGTVDKVVRKIHELGQEGVQFATCVKRRPDRRSGSRPTARS